MHAARPTPTARDQEQHARQVWRDCHASRQPVATFRAGETIRCPGLWNNGLVCGMRVGRAQPGTRVSVRVKDPGNPLPIDPGVELPACPACHTLCEQFVTWDTPLEATGT